MKNSARSIADDLSRRLQGEAFDDVLHCLAYSTDASIYRVVPQCVVMPRGSQDVVSTLEYAGQRGLSVTARGAGSGVAGESLGTGIILDMTRFMKRIVEVQADQHRVTCEPGVVLDDLNARLRMLGLKIGPDPSSGNRATLGGCVANNATGAHSLQFGHMSRYVEGLETVLADGSMVHLENQMALGQGDCSHTQAITGQCLSLLSQHQPLLKKNLPTTQRNRCAYGLAGVVDNDRIDMARLLTGSEGTLGIFTNITLRTVPVPAHTGLLQFEFNSFEQMAAVIPLIVKSGATACELMDRTLMQMAVEALPQYRDIFPAQRMAILLVEQVGDSHDELHTRLEATREAVGQGAVGCREVLDAAGQQRLWKSRKDAVPLLYRRQRGRKQPVAFIEDAAVDPARLAEYIRGLQKISEVHDVFMTFYGHAGDGELHVRPYLDLHDHRDVEKMRTLAREVFELVWSLGGSISGEHGDGLVRAGFVRQQYGDEVYALFRQVKSIFDPEGRLNPGKILNEDPDVMVKSLKRTPDFVPERLESDLVLEPNELEHELLQCNGCGLCRTHNETLRMCPVFRALGDELYSSRAKVNLLQAWATGQLTDQQFESKEFRQFLDLCINCKACQRQCPSGVDVSKVMVMARTEWAARRGLRVPQWVLSHNRWISTLGNAMAPLANLALGMSPVRWLMQKTIGLDRRRQLPAFTQGNFLTLGRQILGQFSPLEHPLERVVYLVDSYVNSYDHDLGRAVLQVLRAHQIEVILPDQRPVPLPAICYGDQRQSQRDFEFLVDKLIPWVEKGYKVICSEPSAALGLRHEMRHFVDAPEARQVSEQTFELMDFLLGLHGQGLLHATRLYEPRGYVYHQPCHLPMVSPEKASLILLRECLGLEVIDLQAGCCGMAGTFGLQRKNRDLSGRIAQNLKQSLGAYPGHTVLTECGACTMQIEQLGIQPVMHPVELLARACPL